MRRIDCTLHLSGNVAEIRAEEFPSKLVQNPLASIHIPSIDGKFVYFDRRSTDCGKYRVDSSHFPTIFRRSFLERVTDLICREYCRKLVN